MKDLDSPEHRSMEREMLREAQEEKRMGHNRFAHITTAIVLFAVAALLYTLGYVWAAAALVVIGMLAEIAAWAFLLGGGEKAKAPADGAAPRNDA